MLGGVIGPIGNLGGGLENKGRGGTAMRGCSMGIVGKVTWGVLHFQQELELDLPRRALGAAGAAGAAWAD